MRSDNPPPRSEFPRVQVRVRQALRPVVDRQQMIDQALKGFGVLGNDLNSPFDPAYVKDLSQREQDIDQAKSLLRQAGQENLDLWSSPRSRRRPARRSPCASRRPWTWS